MKILFILTASLFIFKSALADLAPSFYGFTIGENLGASKSNMKARDLNFVDQMTNAKNIADKRSTFEIMKNPNNCAQEVSKELSTIKCFMTKGDVESLALFYLNNKLVRIVAHFRGQDAIHIKKKIAEKFPQRQVGATKNMIQDFEEVITGKMELNAMLASPFALKGRCSSCDLTMFVQSNASDGVFFMKDGDGLYLTIFSVDSIRSEIDRLKQDNKDQSKTAF